MSDPSQINADESFQKLLADCLEAIERSERVDREHLMREHPDHAASICEFLDNHQLVGAAIGELRNPDQKGVSDSAFAQTVDSQSASSSKTFKIGESLRYVGEYEIVDEIARGGMGIVFRARQSKLGRDVALKMILSGRLASEADVDRFHREARAAAALNHPNIVGVHEVAEHEGHHYFTMDLVAGRNLDSIISEETLSPRKAAELIIAVALAIEYHNQQILIDSMRAIALTRLDRTTESREALVKAESLARSVWPEPQQEYEADYGDLSSYVEARSLLNEARQLIQPTQP